MCSFTVLGGSGGVQKPVSIWCDHHLPSPSHRVDQVVDCGLWNVGPLLFNGCEILAGTGTCCRIRRSRASQTCSMGDMSGDYAGHARTYACPYHNPTATMGHSIYNVDISKPLTHTTPYTLSAICHVQWKPGFIREKNTSPKCQTPSNVSICPLKSVTMTNCSQVETPMRTTSMQMSFPETVSDSLCRNSLVMQTDCCSSCPGGWSLTILEVKMLDVEVLGSGAP